MSRLTVAVAVLLLAAGCSHGAKPVVAKDPRQHEMSAAQAISTVRHTEAWWRHQIRSRARAYPRTHFDNLPAVQLRRRLTDLAARYGFEVVSVELWQPLPRQLAPRLVVKTANRLALAGATPRILKRLDPKRPTGDDRTGWRYEGFFFQADDEHGVPFLAVFNFWRGTYSRGGGQFARSERFYPFAHG